MKIYNQSLTNHSQNDKLIVNIMLLSADNKIISVKKSYQILSKILGSCSKQDKTGQQRYKTYGIEIVQCLVGALSIDYSGVDQEKLSFIQKYISMSIVEQVKIDQHLLRLLGQLSDQQALLNRIDRKKPQVQNITYPNIPNGANITNNYLGGIKKQIVSCKICSKSLDTWIDETKIFTLQECGHKFCKTCIKKYVEQQFLNKLGHLFCVSRQCRRVISQRQLRLILGQTKLEQLQNKVIKKMMNIAQCAKCHYQFEFIAGKIQQSPVFDKNYKALNEEQKKHYANNRFICPNPSCKVQQCKQCKNVPYHLGQTCKSFRQNAYNKLQKVPSVLTNRQRNCRYCLQLINLDNFANSQFQALNDICKDKRCQELAKQACTKILPCGHACCGIRNQQKCIPCLKYECCRINTQLNGQKGIDNCKICQKHPLSRLPCIRSVCGHLFHERCLQKRIQQKWKTQKISFNFCLCPVCKKWLTVPKQSILVTYMNFNLDLFNKIQYLSVERLKFQGHTKDRALVEPSSEFYKNQYSYAMTLYAFYQCFKCKKPYYGGMKSNQGQLHKINSQIKHDQLICPSCCPTPFNDCQKHGKNFIEYKCKFCCSVGVWYYNKAHYCESCYKVKEYISKLTKQRLPPCQGQVRCQIGGSHGGNGDQRILRCSACRNVNRK